MKYLILVSLILLTFNVSAMDMNKEINFSELTTKQKVGQLIIAKPKSINPKWLELELGGIFIDSLNTFEDYKKHIEYYQNNSKIKLFVATDMEGYWNPFNFYDSKNFGEITSKEEAYNLGMEQGKILNDLGFNLDFSPVVEIRNNVWPGRSFTGNKKEISEKIKGYIAGLKNQKIFSTAKHYPGGNLVKNPHLVKYKIESSKDELEMFQVAFDSGVDAVMVGHAIIYGELNSNGKQATISKEIIGKLKEDFNGLIITDAVTMICLSSSYLFNFKKVYPDLILAGNDIILDTHKFSNYRQIKKRINYLSKKAEKNPELMERINESAKKVLEKKGYKIL
jgi:beta-N-acetylhexosaminidase